MANGVATKGAPPPEPPHTVVGAPASPPRPPATLRRPGRQQPADALAFSEHGHAQHRANTRLQRPRRGPPARHAGEIQLPPRVYTGGGEVNLLGRGANAAPTNRSAGEAGGEPRRARRIRRRGTWRQECRAGSLATGKSRSSAEAAEKEGGGLHLLAAAGAPTAAPPRKALAKGAQIATRGAQRGGWSCGVGCKALAGEADHLAAHTQEHAAELRARGGADCWGLTLRNIRCVPSQMFTHAPRWYLGNLRHGPPAPLFVTDLIVRVFDRYGLAKTPSRKWQGFQPPFSSTRHAAMVMVRHGLGQPFTTCVTTDLPTPAFPRWTRRSRRT